YAASPTATGARPIRTGRTACSRWRTGAPRRSAMRCSTASRGSASWRATIARRSTPRRSSRRSASTTSHRITLTGRAGIPETSQFAVRSSQELFERARSLIPGGVNSPVRAMGAVGREPLFIASAQGAEIVDVDGNRYLDYVCSWGPLILGHAHPDVVEAV